MLELEKKAGAIFPSSSLSSRLSTRSSTNYQGEVVFSLLRADDARRQMSLAQPASGQTEFAYEPGVEHNEDDERSEKHEEAVQNVLIDDVVDEVTFEVRLNGGRWRRCRHVRRRVDVPIRRLLIHFTCSYFN